MREWPDAQVVLRVLRAAGARRRWQAAVSGAAMGLAVAAPVVLVALLNGVALAFAAAGATALAMAGAAIAWWRCDVRDSTTASAIEARAPHCRNLVVTAAGLLAGEHARPSPLHVCRVVLHDAATAARAVDLGQTMSWSGPTRRLAGAAVACALVFFVRVPGVERLLPAIGTEASSAPLVSDVRITVIPPSYTGQDRQSLRNPERISALVGSRLELDISGSASTMTIETASSSTNASTEGPGRFTATLEVQSDGFVAVTPSNDAGTTGPRRLIALAATLDRPPSPRIVLPGKDLFLREASAALDLSVEATDDLGLQSLKLAYTKVAGIGESFTFTEGETPLQISRTSARQWTAKGVLPLGQLSLEVGDMVVYRAVATDGRPGARPVESDAFIVEIVSASEAMAEGFAIDDKQDKYALSQQMVILKTERLIAKATGRNAPGQEAILEEAMMIAAEQRSVRAEIVFMMGGHFEDEEVEAEHEHEIAEGRLDNSGRADLGRAIRDMSRAASELTDGNLKPALQAEKAALEAMQRALSRRRFILRTLTQREAIDTTRRLTGSLTAAARSSRAGHLAEETLLTRALRSGLSQILDVSAKPVLSAADRGVVSGVAEALLRAAPGDAATVETVAVLTRAVEALAAGRGDDARSAFTDAAGRMTTSLRTRGTPSVPADDAATRRLKGALRDAVRGGRR